ncbi:M55 family metallopeptidase [Eubacteriales bacterium OttesenSCG-928-A19]|nr:M55 family metallopeptidase [Eubacteriales bacterium OttesenSCG-928-A19]
MKKLFISADIEGTTGIANWDETEYGQRDYDYFRRQMSREVAAACEGALEAGYEDVLVKDAHSTGRNIIPELLPESARILRGWTQELFVMMAGLDKTYDGVVFTGYHSAAEVPANPLSHTMNGKNNHVRINGELASELMINCMTAAMVGVPVFCVTGDRGLCEWIQSVNPNIMTVPVSEGMGNASMSIHPNLAVRRIRETVKEAVKQQKEKCMFPLPAHFDVEINYKQHFDAKNASWYPGCKQTGARTVAFSSDSYDAVLRMLYYVL